MPSRTDTTPDEQDGYEHPALNPNLYPEFPDEDEPSNGPGARTKLTRQTVARIVYAIMIGATYEDAAGYAGVDDSTARGWRQRGREDVQAGNAETPHAAFLAVVKRADGAAAVEWLRDLERAGKDPRNWTASAWRLERRKRASYGRYAADEDESVKQPETGVSVEDLVQALQETLRAQGVDVTLNEDDVVRAYLRKQVGKQRLGVEPREEPTEGDA